MTSGTLADRDVQRRTVRVLSASQALGGIGVATGLAVSTLVAAAISGSDTVGGLAQTSAVVGVALLSLPVARLAARPVVGPRCSWLTARPRWVPSSPRSPRRW